MIRRLIKFTLKVALLIHYTACAAELYKKLLQIEEKLDHPVMHTTGDMHIEVAGGVITTPEGRIMPAESGFPVHTPCGRAHEPFSACPR